MNPSSCECECNKICDFSEYLDYSDCKCRKKLVDKLVDKCTETVEEVKVAEITPFDNKNNYEYNSCRAYIILMIVVFTIFTGIIVYLAYCNWSLINNNNIYCIKFSTHKKNKNLMSAII